MKSIDDKKSRNYKNLNLTDLGPISLSGYLEEFANIGILFGPDGWEYVDPSKEEKTND
jgi:hypothetical protein